MKLIPAIDIMNKQVVRLTKGDENTVTKYETLGTPLEVARFWSSKGAKLLHIIDLDAALNKGDNWELLKLIMDNLDTPVQIGGGIRNHKSAQRFLESGADRIIIGSMAFKSPEQALKLLEEYGKNRIVIALDHIQGKVREIPRILQCNGV
jgi:phosphoribosylformimino-5-aminoimidazole carboxamide ribotide isomerase